MPPAKAYYNYTIKWDFLSEKKVPTKETSLKFEMKVNSISNFVNHLQVGKRS